MASGCCSPKRVRIIRVGDSKAGVTGLDRIMGEAYRQGWRPNQEGLKATLVNALRADGNYVAASSEEAYGEALAELYQKYFDEASSREPARDNDQEAQ